MSDNVMELNIGLLHEMKRSSRRTSPPPLPDHPPLLGFDFVAFDLVPVKKFVLFFVLSTYSFVRFYSLTKFLGYLLGVIVCP